MGDDDIMEVTSDNKPKTAMKISFGMKKREAPNKLEVTSQPVLEVTVDSDEEREHEEQVRLAKRRKITHFEDGAPPEDDDKKKKTAMVIPMVKEHDWRVAKLLELQKEGKLTDEDKAKLAILTEDNPFTSDENIDGDAAIVVDATKKDTEDADYSSVAIEDYGLAMLRGCGWKDGEGIGRNPQVVQLRLLERRPKGLGLGAIPSGDKKKKKDNDNGKDGDKEEEEIKAGSLVRVTTGRKKGAYGKVESRDDDNNSLYVRMALGNSVEKVSLYAVVVVSKKEYERDSKCLNKNEYEKEKEKIERRKEEMNNEKRDKKETESSRVERSSSYKDDRKPEEFWVRAELVVRFVDKEYKKGRYYKQKMNVVDVASRKDITLQADDGSMLYNIRQSYLETVIPRNNGDRLLIVAGKKAGSAAVMEKKDTDRGKIVARIVPTGEVLTLYFDDVCQYNPKNTDDMIESICYL